MCVNIYQTRSMHECPIQPSYWMQQSPPPAILLLEPVEPVPIGASVGHKTRKGQATESWTCMYYI